MTALCFLPSGRRLGPYFVSRCAASPPSRPVAGSVRSRSTTSSAGTACQAMAVVSVLVPAAASMCVLRSTTCVAFRTRAQERKRGRTLATSNRRGRRSLPRATILPHNDGEYCRRFGCIRSLCARQPSQKHSVLRSPAQHLGGDVRVHDAMPKSGDILGDTGLNSRRDRSFPSRHGRDDRRPQGRRRLRPCARCWRERRRRRSAAPSGGRSLRSWCSRPAPRP